MRFTIKKRSQAPTIIIISLIDILIVLLIFLMVTTTFKQQPALKLVLPESKLARPGASEASLVVTVAREAPHFFLGSRAVTLDKLTQELVMAAARTPDLKIAIRADTDAPFGQFIKVMDAARVAGLKVADVHIKAPGP